MMHEGEKFNTITHLVGLIAALIGLVVLIITASRQGEALPIISVTVYGATLVLLYVFSTLNHSLQGAAKKFAEIRFSCNLSSYRWYLYAICLDHSEEGRGLGHFWPCMGACNSGNMLGTIAA